MFITNMLIPKSKKKQQQNNIFYDICSSPVVDRVISSKGICFLALTMCLN